MAKYDIYIKKSAVKEMHKIPKKDLRRISRRINLLAEDPRPAGADKLTGQNHYRVRQGDYRIVYSVQDKEKIVCIMKIGHRREVYSR